MSLSSLILSKTAAMTVLAVSNEEEQQVLGLLREQVDKFPSQIKGLMGHYFKEYGKGKLGLAELQMIVNEKQHRMDEINRQKSQHVITPKTVKQVTPQIHSPYSPDEVQMLKINQRPMESVLKSRPESLWSYFLTFPNKLTQKDAHGRTPLHMAVADKEVGIDQLNALLDIYQGSGISLMDAFHSKNVAEESALSTLKHVHPDYYHYIQQKLAEE